MKNGIYSKLFTLFSVYLTTLPLSWTMLLPWKNCYKNWFIITHPLEITLQHIKDPFISHGNLTLNVQSFNFIHPPNSIPSGTIPTRINPWVQAVDFQSELEIAEVWSTLLRYLLSVILTFYFTGSPLNSFTISSPHTLFVCGWPLLNSLEIRNTRTSDIQSIISREVTIGKSSQ